MNKDWIDINDEIPEKGKEIEYLDSKNHKGFAFLCSCGNEWREIISGGSLMIKVKYWRYTNE